jgi:hypothetical protein
MTASYGDLAEQLQTLKQASIDTDAEAKNQIASAEEKARIAEEKASAAEEKAKLAELRRLNIEDALSVSRNRRVVLDKDLGEEKQRVIEFKKAQAVLEERIKGLSEKIQHAEGQAADYKASFDDAKARFWAEREVMRKEVGLVNGMVEDYKGVRSLVSLKRQEMYGIQTAVDEGSSTGVYEPGITRKRTHGHMEFSDKENELDSTLAKEEVSIGEGLKR